MKRFAILALGLVVAGWQWAGAGGDLTNVVKLDKVQSKVPDTWKAEKPTLPFRLQQFAVPRAAGDDVEAELVISSAGGGVEANLERYRKMFNPPEGKTTKTTVGPYEAHYLDISGTYTPPPFLKKGGPVPNYRLLAVIVVGDSTSYFIRLQGSAKTIDMNKKAFDDWLKAFK